MTRPSSEKDAYERLRSAILTLDLVPGERLSERGLETRLGASRTPIRAALSRLQGEGLTERAGSGWQVTAIDMTEIRAVVEYRAAIETAAVALAVERASAEELAALRTLAETHGDTRDDTADLRERTDFHVMLTGLAGNRFLAAAAVDALTRLARTRWLGVHTAESRVRSRAEHLEIVAAVEARDAGRAVALLTAHSRDSGERLLAHLAEERRRLRGHGLSIVDSSGA
ncbi:GntR family transcriptional regulator [Actinoplanes sp. NPDC020271]|uniref:GntR family transcriptional regulator n=1 Tax=Actinoplanes sp. NPDC020271 TaxID=3363896 RepID=UPI00378EE15C